MNIFQVLSQGKSRLHEPSMSAMLGYLLDSNEDHGLGDAFIQIFLSAIDETQFKPFLSSGFIDSSVSLEVPYQLDGKRKDIDIEIVLADQTAGEYKIIIENKIKVGAANPEQLKDYYQAILEDEQKNVTNLYVIFLTPKSEASRLKAEYDNLNIVDKNHHKKWLYWDSSPDEESIISMIKKVLIREGVGEINPINEYMRHTLKAFIKHASSFTTPIKTARTLRGGDIGDVIDEAEITLLNGSKYRVTRRDSTQIQVFNAETEEKEVARHILGKFIDENQIAIQHETLNTRTIGKKFFEWKYQQGK